MRELRFDPAVLAHVVRGTHEPFAHTVRTDQRRDVDRDAARRGRSTPLRLERDRPAFAGSPGKGPYVRDQGVGGDDLAQVAGRGVVADESSVRIVGIGEAEVVVSVDRDHEHGMREHIEQRRPTRIELALRTARRQPFHISAPRSQRLSARQPPT